jgi:hypothetical protein
MREAKMSLICNTDGRVKECIQNFGWKQNGEEVSLEIELWSVRDTGFEV